MDFLRREAVGVSRPGLGTDAAMNAKARISSSRSMRLESYMIFLLEFVERQGWGSKVGKG